MLLPSTRAPCFVMGNKTSAPTSKEDFHVIQQEARVGGEQDYKGVKERVKTRLGRRLSKLEKNLISDNLKNKTRMSVANVTNVLPYKPNSAANAAGAGQAPMLGNVGRDLFREQLVHDALWVVLLAKRWFTLPLHKLLLDLVGRRARTFWCLLMLTRVRRRI